jgi:hypothetical protein
MALSSGVRVMPCSTGGGCRRARSVIELLPNGELATLSGQGHGVPLSTTEVAAHTTIDFLDRVSRLHRAAD